MSLLNPSGADLEVLALRQRIRDLEAELFSVRGPGGSPEFSVFAEPQHQQWAEKPPETIQLAKMISLSRSAPYAGAFHLYLHWQDSEGWRETAYYISSAEVLNAQDKLHYMSHMLSNMMGGLARGMLS